jgi:hypothetical protein
LIDFGDFGSKHYVRENMMLKQSLKPISIAVTLALASVSAHALNAPAIGTAAPGFNGLYLSVWDSNGNNSEVVNLSYAYADITAAGALTPDSASSPFTTATNPATGTGSVLQLNFGTIPGFSSLFTSSNIASTEFMVTAAVSGGEPTEAAAVTYNGTPTISYSAMTALTNSVQGEIAAWEEPSTANSGYVTDTTGQSLLSVQGSNGTLGGGNLGLSGASFGGAVGTALNFYNYTTTKSGHNNVAVITPFANSTGNGFWFLSTSGVLSYDVPTSAVPLPAAVWLLGSGLLGLAGISRRRIAA